MGTVGEPGRTLGVACIRVLEALTPEQGLYGARSSRLRPDLYTVDTSYGLWSTTAFVRWLAYLFQVMSLGETYLVNAFAMVEMCTLGQLSHLLLQLVVTKTD